MPPAASMLSARVADLRSVRGVVMIVSLKIVVMPHIKVFKSLWAIDQYWTKDANKTVHNVSYSVRKCDFTDLNP